MARRVVVDSLRGSQAAVEPKKSTLASSRLGPQNNIHSIHDIVPIVGVRIRAATGGFSQQGRRSARSGMFLGLGAAHPYIPLWIPFPRLDIFGENRDDDAGGPSLTHGASNLFSSTLGSRAFLGRPQTGSCIFRSALALKQGREKKERKCEILKRGWEQ